MGHSFTTSYLSTSCPTAKRSIYLSPQVVSRHNLQPWQASSNVLKLPFQECTKCHTTTTELHQSSFYGQKKTTSPQILLSLNGLQFSTYAEHSNIRTYIMSKIPPEILVQQVLDLWAVVFSGKPS